jgi:galactose mutarotase-like enzyme
VRKAAFQTAIVGPSAVTYEYRDNEETREMYPFAFTFQVIFEVTGNTLTTTYNVINRGEKTMYFSAGSHEAFNCPWQEGEAFEDYYLEFDSGTTVRRLSAPAP